MSLTSIPFQGVYAPGRASGNEVIAYEGAVTKLTADMLNAYNADLRAWFVTNPAAFQQNAVVQRVKETAAAVNGLSKAQTARSKEVRCHRGILCSANFSA